MTTNQMRERNVIVEPEGGATTLSRCQVTGVLQKQKSKNGATLSKNGATMGQH